MLRTLLVGILVVSAAASCSKKSDAPAATPGATAGKVVEVTGTVTATRGSEVRPLAAGGEISSDDVIDTAADSRVVILVAHNNARWDLGPNKHGKVADSLAWTAAKQDRPATAVTEVTSTAGRYADKNAATTDTTTARNSDNRSDEPDMMPKGGESAATDQPPAVQAAEQHRPSAAPRPGAATTKPPTTTTAPPPPPPPPAKPDPATADPGTADPAPREKEAKEIVADEEAQKVAPKTDTSRRKVADVGIVDAKKPASPGRKANSVANPVPPTKVVAGPEQTLQVEIRSTFAKQRAAIAACLDAGTKSLEVSITVTKGIYSFESTDAAATDKVRACLARIAKPLTAKTKLDTAVKLQLTVTK